MNNFVKIGLIGAALWWLLKDNIAFAASEALPPTGDTGTAAPGASSSQAGQTSSPLPPAVIPPPLQTQPRITDAMITKAAADPALAHTVPGVLMTADEWNYYNALATGVQTTTDLFVADRGEKITAVEYWNRRQAAGLGRLVWR